MSQRRERPGISAQAVARCATLALLATLLGTGCEKHDIGKPCPELELAGDATNTGEGSVETQEVVEQNVAFPCDELICIATAGRPGYCSKKCRENAGCPDGFECREIQPVGPFAGEKFCAWKPCKRPASCGDAEDFCCVTVQNSDPIEDLKFCAFRDSCD